MQAAKSISHDLFELLSLEKNIESIFNSESIVRFLLTTLSCGVKLLIMRLALLHEYTTIESLVGWFCGSYEERLTIAKKLISFCSKNSLISIIIRSNTEDISDYINELKFCINNNLKNTLTKLYNNDKTNKDIFQYEKIDELVTIFIKKKNDLLSTEEINSICGKTAYNILKKCDKTLQSIIDVIDIETLQEFSKIRWSNFYLWSYVNSNIITKLKLYFKTNEPMPISQPLAITMKKYNIISYGRISIWFLLSLRNQIYVVLRTFMKHFCPSSHTILMYTVLCGLANGLVNEAYLITTVDKYIYSLLLVCQDLGIIKFNDKYPNIIHLSPLVLILKEAVNLIHKHDDFTISQYYCSNIVTEKKHKYKLHLLPYYSYDKYVLVNNNCFGIDLICPFNVTLDPLNTLKQSEAWYRYLLKNNNRLAKASAYAIATNKYEKSIGSDTSGIICESNFRVYLIQPDIIQASILENFAEIGTVTSHIVTAMIRRDAVIKAYKENITSYHIIDFLKSRASKHVTDYILNSKDYAEKSRELKDQLEFYNINLVTIPENVKNQLLLWEKQKSSVKIDLCAIIEFNQVNELHAYPLIINQIGDLEGVFYYTKLDSEITANTGEKFKQWMENVIQRTKESQNYMLFGQYDNVYARFPIIVVDIQLKNKLLKRINEIIVAINN